MMFELQGSLTLDPVWWRDPPLVVVKLNNRLIYQGHISSLQVISLNSHMADGRHVLSVDLCNKEDHDTDIERGLDKAVVIRSLEFFGITDPRFVWAGEYQPVYNKHWVAEQQQQGSPPAAILKSQTYLGWNGTWRLDFSIPIFTWIHSIQYLGWIYD